MNENENNFEPLRRLLALKRYETPPPGYFENFSSKVTARIRAGEAGRAERFARQLPWLSRLLSAFEAKPAFAGAFACSLCLLLLFGIVYAERPDVAPQTLLQTAQTDSPLAVPTSPTTIALNTMPAEQPALIPISSTNPVFNSRSAGSLFASQGSQEATVQQIPYILPGN
jgi:hypothetical protein